MAIDQRFNEPWTRKHDNPQKPFISKASKIMYPLFLEEVIEICSKRQPNEFLKAAGSHWALSDAARSDNAFVESNDPNNVHPPMGRTLYEVVPGCLNKNFVNFLTSKHPKQFGDPTAQENEGIYLAHFETGKRVYQLYSELDLGEDANDPNGKSLAHVIRDKYGNSDYFGSWAFHTMGGAGGQTVFGALTTGTHGGDFRFPPIADYVVAMHLVADGGKHYWIERESNPEWNNIPLTDDVALYKLYGDNQYKGNESSGVNNFQIMRNDDLFNALLISAGRFGIVYSVVIRAVRQYCLHEERRLDDWQNIRGEIKDRNSSLFTGNGNNRFLQIAISVTPYANSTKNLCGITKRFNAPGILVTPGTSSPSGRLERRGNIDPNNRPVYDSRIRAPWFDNAGNSFGYNPDPSKPNNAQSASFLDIASTNSDFIDGAIKTTVEQLKDFINKKPVETLSIVAAVALATAIATLGISILIAALVILLRDIIEKEIELIAQNKANGIKSTFAEVLNAFASGLMSDPNHRAEGIFVWQCIAYGVFADQQKEMDFEAISYAVMDRFSYPDRSQQVSVDSIEVFFAAEDDELIAFVDSLLEFEKAQERDGKVFIGYISLRFMADTKALIGMQQFERTVSVEVAGLLGGAGSKPLIDFALRLAANPNFKGIVHWGQRNTQTMDNIQFRFGDTINDPSGNLNRWRRQLSFITANGRLNGFSSNFTRRLGLEIVEPKITNLMSNKYSVTAGQRVTITWDCMDNPPYTVINLEVSLNNQTRTFAGLQFSGIKRLTLSTRWGIGVANVTLTTICTLNRESRARKMEIQIAVV